jgi:DNA invertase Pin-like site-specific DNA recombinase
MNAPQHPKIQAHHLSRKALVYVRQSTLHQVFAHGESTARQYGLTATAQDFGWPDSLVEVIDDDLGQSGSSATHRHGFQRLVADVALGQVGIVMGLEISRLARNNADFQQLLQICGLNQTLIGDADAIYDLSQLNDRLVLGLKGTMSEAELFTMRARLQGGLRHKAARGELATKLPIGFVYAPAGKVTLDPDQHVQEAIQLLFQTFRQVGSSIGVVRYFNHHGLTFPTRPIKGPHCGEVWWTALSSSLALRILHNPRYAGAFAYGRTRLLHSPRGGAAYQKRKREAWHALVQQAHPGYISWEEFEANQERLQRNMTCHHQGPARQGAALLQGLVLCGTCGRNMSTSYKRRAGGRIDPIYTCNRAKLDYSAPICTSIPGGEVDRMLSSVLLEQVTPLAMEAALSVQQEILKRAQEAEKLLHRQVERAQYDADLAKRRLMAVDPANRHVAQTLENDWNDKLAHLQQAKQEYETRRAKSRYVLDVHKQAEIRRLATDFPRIWSHPATSHQDKKRMARLLIEDVTLRRDAYSVTLFIRFKAGAILTRMVRLSRSGNKATRIAPALIVQIDALTEQHTAGEVATKLNEAGIPHPTRGDFDTNAVVYLLKRFKLPSRYQRLRVRGYWTQEEIAERFGVNVQTVQRWRKNGWIHAVYYNDQKEYLYEPFFEGLPRHSQNQTQPSATSPITQSFKEE